jgi:uncharacterized protein
LKRAAFCLALVAANQLFAAEVMPPKPAHYFNDYVGFVSQSAAEEFDRQLAQFERETSNQVVVAIFPKMESDSEINDYTQRVAESWRVGQQDKGNGVVLFVFIEPPKMIIRVGYGLEGAFPDATAFEITEYYIKPQFIAGDFEGGLRTGIDLICKAIRGDYTGRGETVTEQHHRRSLVWPSLFFALLFVLSLIGGIHRAARPGYGYSSKGRGWTIDWGDVFLFWLNLGGSSGRSSSSGSSSSSGFSGGGGSFGGGGAGSSW